MDTFLGEPVAYWLELKRLCVLEEGYPERRDLLIEVMALRGKVAFYEERVRQMNEFVKEST